VSNKGFTRDCANFFGKLFVKSGAIRAFLGDNVGCEVFVGFLFINWWEGGFMPKLPRLLRFEQPIERPVTWGDISGHPGNRVDSVFCPPSWPKRAWSNQRPMRISSFHRSTLWTPGWSHSERSYRLKLVFGWSFEMYSHGHPLHPHSFCRKCSKKLW